VRARVFVCACVCIYVLHFLPFFTIQYDVFPRKEYELAYVARTHSCVCVCVCVCMYIYIYMHT
jgi:hypothetical protein